MGIRMWWTRLVGRRPGRNAVAEGPPPVRTRAEQDVDREERRHSGMSDEDRAWEQASLQRDRERQQRAAAPPQDG